MALKKVVWVNPNRMLVESGHKTFDRQCDYVGEGNVISDCQHSSYIRPYDEVECNGHVRDKGHLREFDLKVFGDLPLCVRNRVLSLTHDESVILYEFRHWNGGEKVVDGYVVTTPDNKHPRMLYRHAMKPFSERVLDACIPYITAD